MSITYAITVCNELEEIQQLLPHVINNLPKDCDVQVLYDSTNGTPEVLGYLSNLWEEQRGFQLLTLPFEGDFAQFKNNLSRFAAGDYVCQIDADEFPPTEFIQGLPALLGQYVGVDLFYVARRNMVHGLTQQDITRWGWTVTTDSSTNNTYVNYPDFQGRVYRRDPSIEWKGQVHERIEGAKKCAFLPHDPIDGNPWSWLHEKTIDKQRKQNEFYETI